MIAEHCADSDCNTGDLLFKMHFVDYKLQITPKTSTRTLGIIWQWRNNIFCSKEHNYFPTWGNYKNYKRVAGLGRPTFCDKLKARTHIFHVFTFTSFHLVTIFTSKTWFHKFFFCDFCKDISVFLRVGWIIPSARNIHQPTSFLMWTGSTDWIRRC